LPENTEGNVSTRVGIVILGDEVLQGETKEANIAYMLPLLSEWGAETVFCAILPTTSASWSGTCGRTWRRRTC